MNNSVGVQVFRASLAACLIALTGCAATPASPPHEPEPPPPPITPPPDEPPADTHIYVYPAKGQSEQQTDRDRYECHLWAVRQTHFDPSAISSRAPAPQVVVVHRDGPTRDQAAAQGALGGAAVGAAVSRYGKEAEGAIVGAVVGGVLGAASVPPDSPPPPPVATADPHAADLANYRRALGACLAGRGYTVSK